MWNRKRIGGMRRKRKIDLQKKSERNIKHLKGKIGKI
jgi:hypothetical protein